MSTVVNNPGWSPSEPPSLDGIDRIELDCETNGLRWWDGDLPIGIGIGTPDETYQYLPWGHAGGNLSEGTVKRWAQRELRNKQIFGLNIKFDNHMFYRWGIDLEAQGCTISDVGHRAALLDDHRRRFSLEALSQDLLGKGKLKDVDVEHMAEYHAGDVHDYAEQDVRLVRELRDHLDPQLDEQNLRHVCDLEDRVAYVVCEMERNAAPLNAELLKSWVKRSEEEYHRCLWKVYRETGLKPSFSNADLETLFKARKIPIIHRTATGMPSFAEETGIWDNCDDPVIQDMNRARKLTSLRSKYLVKYLNTLTDDGRLLYALHQLRADEGGAVTGRFSSSAFKTPQGAEGANVQQVKTVEKQKEVGDDDYTIRELFISRSGRSLKSDASQIEFRLFAHYANSERLLKEYRKDPTVNFHKIVWELVKQYNDISYKALKNLNFCKLYGGGVGRVSEMLEVSYDEAESFAKSYDEAFTDVKRCLRLASNTARSQGYVKTLMGRRIRFPKLERLYKALNGIIQGGAADIMKQKLVELHDARRTTGFVMRFTVHDEVFGDIPDDEAASKVDKILNRQSFDLRVPILWETKTGANWAECA